MMSRAPAMSGQYDYIVVGAGTAGCVVATRLSADPGTTVLLVEAGPAADGDFLVRLPLGVGLLPRRTDLSWNYQAEPEPELDGRRIAVPRGRLVGGTGSINGSTHVRAHRLDYDDWASNGAVGWGHDDLLPYFRRSERSWRGASDSRGDSGPVTVTAPARRGPFGQRLDSAARSLGIAFPADPQAGDPTGAGPGEASIRRGRRHSTAAAYLRPVLRHRANLTLLTGATAGTVVIEGGRAAGVELHDGGGRRVVRADREVVLSAGTYNTPQLLMRSGIGPADHLREHGISPVADLPGVGGNLQEHPAVPLVFDVNAPVTFHDELRADRLLLNGLRWLVTGGGPLGEMPELLSVYVRTRPGLDRPDGFLAILAGGFEARPWFPGIRPLRDRHCLALNAVATPRSRGTVRLSSAGPAAPPRIRFNFFADRDDLVVLRETVKTTREILASPVVAELIAAELLPGPGVRTDEEYEAFLRAAVSPGNHACGTCAIGSGDLAVVDRELRVRGVTGLRVADASVFPAIPGANINATVIAVAEKASDLIAGALRESGESHEPDAAPGKVTT